ncbi:hypothetical protein CHI12_14355 [Terribacillus saccharophilus]|uniref:DUF3278 domain-containing protein n=1 Tax=Terribacillus saccharophilus TaxID=361277 RepID=A0A268HAB3_9BACI|nr:hypothetical protein [Terribacillus saccharophilus]PAE06784.1 hypothetical protein CHI12_14355 [Terribacillus saccharophilus]
MERTWIRFLLPDDEYKRRTILVYFAEAVILQLIAVLTLIVISRFDFFPMDGVIVLIGMLFGTMAYVWIRYILSGMEFAEIMTAKAYRRERKLIIIKSTSFLVIMCASIASFDVFGMMSVPLIEGLIVSFIAALLLFLTNYVSLKRSYWKNRELID